MTILFFEFILSVFLLFAITVVGADIVFGVLERKPWKSRFFQLCGGRS